MEQTIWQKRLHDALLTLRTCKGNNKGETRTDTVSLHVTLPRRKYGHHEFKRSWLTLPHARTQFRVYVDSRLDVRALEPLYNVTREDQIDCAYHFGYQDTTTNNGTKHVQWVKRRRLTRWIRRYDVFVFAPHHMPSSRDLDLFHTLAKAEGRPYRIVQQVDKVTCDWLATRSATVQLIPHVVTCVPNLNVAYVQSAYPSLNHTLDTFVKDWNAHDYIKTHLMHATQAHVFRVTRIPGERLETWLPRTTRLRPKRKKQAQTKPDVLIVHQHEFTVDALVKLQKYVAHYSPHTCLCLLRWDDDVTRFSQMLANVANTMLLVANARQHPQRPTLHAVIGNVTMPDEQLVDNALAIVKAVYQHLKLMHWTLHLNLGLKGTRLGYVKVKKK